MMIFYNIFFFSAQPYRQWSDRREAIELELLSYTNSNDNDRWLHKKKNTAKFASEPHALVKCFRSRVVMLFFFGVGRSKKISLLQCFDSEQLWYQMLTRPTKCSRFSLLMMNSSAKLRVRRAREKGTKAESASVRRVLEVEKQSDLD